MLSLSARPYIRASVPVLREHGETISRRFYADLFEAHPELLSLFNLGNQANGAQQRSLATALLAYAANIDRPEVLEPVVARIAHKHASLGIQPRMYPIVARHLIGAMKHVLGDAATPALLAAWDEAYWLLAGELIAAEARLYALARVEAGQFAPLTVASVRRESEYVSSYLLQREDGTSPGPFVPGQFVSVAVDLPGEGFRQLRQYSLSDAPTRPHWRITVKREPRSSDRPAGRISNHLHDTLAPGDRLLVGPAFGNFEPSSESTRPLALLSAGVGIAPMVSALNTLAEQRSDRPVLFAHANRGPEHCALRTDVERAQEALPGLKTLHFFEEAKGASNDEFTGRMALTPDRIASFEDADFYLCGPLPFMREQFRSLLELGVPPERVHREVFGPDLIDDLF
jgi:nitric oxide dioxygenase